MTRADFESLVREIDPVNAEYILADSEIIEHFERVTRWENRDPVLMSVVEGIDREKRMARIVESSWEDLREKIGAFDRLRLTPANVKVGDGVTVNLWSDRHAGTIERVTKASIVIRRDKATLDPSFKPDWIPGGFSAICTNQEDQEWHYEPDPKGQLYTIRWSRKYNRYGTPGNLTASKGRHEFYDYNF